MKIIVCGAGSVGRSIVSYLVKGNNDIVVIDNDQRNLDSLASEFDIQPVFGSASHPEILENADARHTEMIIAVTNNDEVNMIACQVAYSIFNIPRKIARIDAQDFIEPLWATLYNDHHIPVDLIISPEIEIGKYIYQMLKVPGASEVLPLYDGQMQLLAFRIPETSPLLKTSMLYLSKVVPDLEVEIVCINRKGRIFIPYQNDTIEAEDEVYFLVKTEKLSVALEAFGVEHPAIERVILFGGNQISRYIGKLFEKDDNIISCKIIEEDVKSARSLAKELNNTIVLNGPQMSDVILNEAGIDNTDATIAVTIKDKDNLLASMLAHKSGVSNTIALINSPSYNSLIDIIADNILVDRSSVTISSILQELRKSRISNAFSLGRGFGEVWEMEVFADSPIADIPIANNDLPASSKICAIKRDGKILFPGDKDKVQGGDVIILYVDSASIRKVEKVLS